MDAIRNAMAESLREIPDMNNVSPYLTVQPIPPMLEIYPDKFFFDKGFSTDELRFKVRAIIGSVLNIEGQQYLDSLLDSSGEMSVKAALEADRQLGGLVDDLRVEEVSGYRLYPYDAGPGQQPMRLLGCEWEVCILSTR